MADMGVPLFAAPPRSGAPGEFHYPSDWQNFRPQFAHAQVERWRPGWCLAMVTGVVFDVIDVDPRNGGDLAALGELPTVYGVQATPSAGSHHLIARTRLAKGKPAPGIDLQAGADVPDAVGSYGRGFVFLAPTVRPSKWGPNKGRDVAYRWGFAPAGVPGNGAGPDDAALARLVELASAVRAPRAAPAVIAPTRPDDPDDPFDGPAENWTHSEATAIIRRQLATVEKAAAGQVNSALGGAARVLGRFVATGHLEGEKATEALRTALAAGGVHSDSWNATHGLKWTAASVIEAGLRRGMLEPWTVAPPAVRVVTTEATGGAPRTTPGPTEVILPPPGQPYHVARELLAVMPQTDGELHQSWWRGDFYRWTGAHWEVRELPAVERWLYRHTGDATYLVPAKEDGGEAERRPWAPTKKKVGDLVHALGVGTLQRQRPEDHVLACANGVVDVASRELRPHRPSRFNLFSLPFGYDPEATAPGWEAFLEQVLPGDVQAKDFLAEWFGYVLSGRTDQQKMAALIGKRRSGKGTIARVLGAMVGSDNTAGLDLNMLPGTFGMENLVGKALAVSGDVRWASRNIADAVPILLGVIGEDAISVHRKNRMAWSGTLGVRFMLMSNETPTFSDRSNALSGRMVFVRFDQSFYGREDSSLTEKLLGELPGILNWALDGLARLSGRGCFTQPESGMTEAEHSRRLSDPVGAFLEDWCQLGPGESITLDHLFLKYQDWCLSEGRTKDSTTKEIFARDLRGKVPDLVAERRQVNGKRQQYLTGIGSTVL